MTLQTKKLTPVKPAYLSRRDAAVYLGITTRVLDTLKDRGEIPFYKLSRRNVVLKISDMEAYMSGKRVDISEKKNEDM